MKKWWIFCAVLLAILSGSLIYYYTFHFHPESEAAPRTARPEQAIYPLQSEQKGKKSPCSSLTP
ncbi:hypothetical protein GCM10010965_13450 [Caldalkalibacillus thermarum]|uniref:hypothetical protein n=1 Tax=Caldalkalibacillus thermarum TaxID=296745 RepID=UPI0016691D77|nr:hypothetical protein [Caldalkalibacillus thermarum]GGK21787.1 hypothetical protein GCM10010965_13450 [Caldalkalibacillus thermarum]